MEKADEKIIMGEPFFWKKWLSKLLYTLISVKVWGLIAGTWVSTCLLIYGYICQVQWLTFNTTIWALIFGMKEIFRISEKRDNTENMNLKEQIASKLEITKLMTNKEANNPSQTTFTEEGFEIVGDEPDTNL